MASDREITVVIRADGTAAIAGIRSVGDETERLGKRTQTTMQKLKENWMGMTAAAVGAYVAMQRVWSLAEAAAEYQERLAVLNSLTAQYNTTAQATVAIIQRNANGLVSMGAAASVATDALSKGFRPEQVAQMAKWSTTLSDTSASAGTAEETFIALEKAITAAREKGLVNFMGAQIDLQAKFGTQYELMTKAQKAQEAYLAVQELMIQKSKNAEIGAESLADKMERVKVTVEDLKLTVGDFIIRAGAGLLGVFQTMASFALYLASGVAHVGLAIGALTDMIGVTEGAADSARGTIEAFEEASMFTAKQAADSFEVMRQGYADVNKARAEGDSGNDEAVAKHQEWISKMKELNTKYVGELEVLQAAETDRTLVALNQKYRKELEMLDKNNADHKTRMAAFAVYSAQYDKEVAERAGKIAEFYRKEQADQQAQLLKQDQANRDAATAARIADVQAEQAARENMMRARGASETGLIREKAAGEREILAIRQEALVNSITEFTTFEETLEIMRQHRALQEEIERSKRVEVAELDVARVESEREILRLRLQSLEALLSAQEQMRAGVIAQGSEAGPGGGEIAGGLFDIASQAEGTDPYTIRLEQAKLYWEEMLSLWGGGLATIEQTEAAHAQYKVLLDNQTNAMRFQSAASYLSVMQGALAAANSFAAGKSKEMFVVSKAVAVAMAIVQAHVAAIGAAAAVAGTPIVGPALAAAAYSKMLTLGYVNAGIIAATAIGQAATMKSGGSASFVSAGGGVALSAPQAAATPTQEKATAPVINVHIYGNVVDHDAFARELTPALTKAWADGAR